MTDAVAATSPIRGSSLFITGLGIAQICSWGSLYYSFPQIAEQMGGDLGWSKQTLYGAAALGLILSGLLAYPVGSAIDRGHGRTIMTLASALAGVLLIVWSQVTDIWLLYALAAGVGALQAATLYDPAFAVVARRTGAGAARDAITALTLWGGFASTVFIPLNELLIHQLGWRGCLIVLGAINLAVCATLYARMIDPKADAVSLTVSQEGLTKLPQRGGVRRALRNPVFWALALAFTAYSASFSTFIFHLYPLLTERGYSSGAIVLAMGLIGPAQVAGRIALWTFAPRAPARVVGSITVIAFPIAFGLFLFVSGDLLLLLGASVLYGAANGIMTIVRGIAVPEMLSRNDYGAINGALGAPMVVAKAIGPIGGAALWAIGGHYGPMLAAVVLLSLVLAGSFWAAAALTSTGQRVR